MEVAEEPMMEVTDEPMMEVTEELNTLALDNNNNSASTDVSFNLRYGLNNLKLFVKVAGVLGKRRIKKKVNREQETD